LNGRKVLRLETGTGTPSTYVRDVHRDAEQRRKGKRRAKDLAATLTIRTRDVKGLCHIIRTKRKNKT